MNGQHSKLLFTSPPYSDMREYNGGKDLSVESIAQFISCYEPFTALQAVNLGIQRKDGEIYPYWNAYIDTAKKAGLKLLAWNVWDKLTCGSVGQQSAMIPIRHLLHYGARRALLRRYHKTLGEFHRKNRCENRKEKLI